MGNGILTLAPTLRSFSRDLQNRSNLFLKMEISHSMQKCNVAVNCGQSILHQHAVSISFTIHVYFKYEVRKRTHSGIFDSTVQALLVINLCLKSVRHIKKSLVGMQNIHVYGRLESEKRR